MGELKGLVIEARELCEKLIEVPSYTWTGEQCELLGTIGNALKTIEKLVLLQKQTPIAIDENLSKKELEEIHDYLLETRQKYLKPYKEVEAKKIEALCQKLEQIMS
jgi:hypothetical protein